MDSASFPNILGFISLIFYILTLLPSMLRVVVPQSKATGIPQLLMKHRRSTGILAFLFALGHGLLLLKQRNLDFLDATTYWFYLQGLVPLIIFTLLGVTSNDWSIKRLKKNWKRLHQLTYIAMFMLAWHVWGKMSGQWTYLTPIAITAIFSTIVLFLGRRWQEHQRKSKKKAPTPASGG